MKRRFSPFFAVWATAACCAAGLSCYEMNVRPTQLGSIKAASQCEDFVHDQLTRLGYRPVQRVVGTHAMFSKDTAFVSQAPISTNVPARAGGLIGVRVTSRDDGGCVLELVPATYDCLSSPADAAFAHCELTPGGPADVEADIAQIAREFRGSQNADHGRNECTDDKRACTAGRPSSFIYRSGVDRFGATPASGPPTTPR